MTFKDACKIGFNKWAYRLSNDDLLFASSTGKKVFLYNGVEKFSCVNYNKYLFRDWIPCKQHPNYIPEEQKMKWYRDFYKKQIKNGISRSM